MGSHGEKSKEGNRSMICEESHEEQRKQKTTKYSTVQYTLKVRKLFACTPEK
jgi:hypothetical protein